MLKINGKSLEDLGLVVTAGGFGAAWSGPQLSRESVPVTARFGAVPINEALGAPKVIPLQLALPASLSERRAKLDAVLGHLTGLLEIVWDDAPDRVQFGRVDQAEVRERFDHLPWKTGGQGHLLLSIPVILDRPLSYAQESRTLAIGATPVVVKLGSAPSDSVIILPGPLNSATIAYRGITGDVLASLVLTGTVDADEWLEIRSDRNAIYHGSSSGVEIDMSFFGSGSFIILDPADGDPDNMAGPTIESDVGGILHYREVWR